MFSKFAFSAALLGLLSTVTAAPASADLPARATPDGASGGGKVFMGYWSIWAGQNKALPTKEHLSGLTHVILSFVNNATVMTTNPAAVETGPEGWMFSSSNSWNHETAAALRKVAGNEKLKVMAAVGGWGLEQPFNAAVRGGQIDQFVNYCVSFVEAYKLDGLDLDWEYPVGGGEYDRQEYSDDKQGFESLLKALRAALPEGKLLTVAIGSKEEGLKGFTKDMVPKYDQYVDYWNVMTYDYTNRRDNKTGFHAPNSIMETVVADLQTRGFTIPKLVLGYPMYAKWFKLTPEQAQKCSPEKAIGCEMGPYEGADAQLSGVWTWNEALNIPPAIGDKHTPTSQLGLNSAKTITDWNAYDDKTALGSATVDTVNGVFWTWMSPYDVGQTCAKWHKKTAGTMYWSMLQDSDVLTGGPHVEALQTCVGA